ncbi:MAG: T9SS type A sorting domain-containing protein [Bacteroidota bacterium]
MRYLNLFLFGCLLIILNRTVIAQNAMIIAGSYDSTMTYYNIEPDTVLPHEETLHGYSQSYSVDLNFDGIYDYTIKNHVLSGLGGSVIGVWVVPLNGNQVNYFRIDSAENSYNYYYISKPFFYGDTIDDSFDFISNTSYLYYSRWLDVGGELITINDWKDQGEKYLGLKMIIEDTIVYGWLRLQVNTYYGWPETTIMDYALSKIFTNTDIERNYDSTSISFYPNPTCEELNVKLPASCKNATIIILDLNGIKQVQRIISNSRSVKINTSFLQNGLYIISVKTESAIYNSKVIKK